MHKIQEFLSPKTHHSLPCGLEEIGVALGLLLSAWACIVLLFCF